LEEITKRCWIVSDGSQQALCLLKFDLIYLGAALFPLVFPPPPPFISIPPRTNVFFRSQHEDAKESKREIVVVVVGSVFLEMSAEVARVEQLEREKRRGSLSLVFS
jgi:hypothetical protein